MQPLSRGRPWGNWSLQRCDVPAGVGPLPQSYSPLHNHDLLFQSCFWNHGIDASCFFFRSEALFPQLVDLFPLFPQVERSGYASCCRRTKAFLILCFPNPFPYKQMPCTMTTAGSNRLALFNSFCPSSAPSYCRSRFHFGASGQGYALGRAHAGPIAASRKTGRSRPKTQQPE